jgi:ribosome-associated heat shock protein Hsp15
MVEEKTRAVGGESLRIDKWLWCARFFKSRAAAQEAVAGGRVHVNGERVKPSRAVRAGDVVTVTREPHEWEVTVTGIPARRGPAPEARMHYEETSQSIQQREARRQSARYDPAAPAARPDKHDRQALRRLRGR